MNSGRPDPGCMTLGGIFMDPRNKDCYKDAVVWGGNVYQERKSNGFHRKRTFMSEWQSAANNSGVFVNK
jgi:hypothetical protein